MLRSSPSMSRRTAPKGTRCGTPPSSHCITRSARSDVRSSSRPTGTTGATTQGQTLPRSTDPLPWGPERSVHVPLLRAFRVYWTRPPLAARWALKYLTGVTWPYDAANAHAALENALSLLEQDLNLTWGQRATF